MATFVEHQFKSPSLGSQPYAIISIGFGYNLFQAFLQDLSEELRPRGRAPAAQPAAPGARPQVPALRQHVQAAAGARRAHQATHRRETVQVSRVVSF